MSLSNSMTSGSPLKHIVSFAIPITLDSLFQLIYSIVDSAVVGRLIGVDAFASVGAAGLTMISGFVELVARLLVVFTLPGLIGRWGIYLVEVSSWPPAMLFLCISFFVVYKKRCKMFLSQAADEKSSEDSPSLDLAK